MHSTGDPLFARASEVLRSARDVRKQTQEIIDSARLERLQRELAEKIVAIERAVSRG